MEKDMRQQTGHRSRETGAGRQESGGGIRKGNPARRLLITLVPLLAILMAVPGAYAEDLVCTVEAAPPVAPVIESSQPASDPAVAIAAGSYMDFSVKAYGQSGHTLTYTWKLDGTSVASSPTTTAWRYSPLAADIVTNPHTVTETVSDGALTAEKTWNVTVVNVTPWINSPPTAPQIISPPNGGTNVNRDVDLSWTASTDPDEGDTVAYDVYFGTNSSALQLVATNLSYPFYGAVAPAISPLNIAVWYGDNQRFGQNGLGIPQRWVNILGNVSGGAGATTLTYSLNGGAARPLTVGPDARRLEYAGDFNVEMDRAELISGNNMVAITARDYMGVTETKFVTINYTTGTTWPLPYSINWSAVTNIQDVAQVIDGKWNISGGKLNQTNMGYDRFVAIGDLGWTNYEVTVPITLNGPPSSDKSGTNLGIVLRWQGHWGPEKDLGSPSLRWPDVQPTIGWWPVGAFAVYTYDYGRDGYRLQIRGNNWGVLANDASAMQLVVGHTYIFKAKVVGTLYTLKVWEQGTPEGNAVILTVNNNPTPTNLSGSFLIGGYYADVSFGNITVTEVTQ